MAIKPPWCWETGSEIILIRLSIPTTHAMNVLAIKTEITANTDHGKLLKLR
jgi:hypothetical protein